MWTECGASDSMNVAENVLTSSHDQDGTDPQFTPEASAERLQSVRGTTHPVKSVCRYTQGAARPHFRSVPEVLRYCINRSR